MKLYSHADPDVKPILERIKNTANISPPDPPYWVLAHNSDPIGIVGVAKEPGPLLASPGTPYAYVNWVDTKQPKAFVENFYSDVESCQSKECGIYPSFISI